MKRNVAASTADVIERHFVVCTVCHYCEKRPLKCFTSVKVIRLGRLLDCDKKNPAGNDVVRWSLMKVGLDMVCCSCGMNKMTKCKKPLHAICNFRVMQ